MVDYVAAGHRYKLRFDRAKVFFWFNVNSVKTFQSNDENPLHQKWAKKSQNFASQITN